MPQWLDNAKVEFKKAQIWLDDNKENMTQAGSEMKKLYDLMNGMISGGHTVETPKAYTKWADVNEILEQARGVDDVINSKMGDGWFEDCMKAVDAILKIVVLGSAII